MLQHALFFDLGTSDWVNNVIFVLHSKRTGIEQWLVSNRPGHLCDAFQNLKGDGFTSLWPLLLSLHESRWHTCQTFQDQQPSHLWDVFQRWHQYGSMHTQYINMPYAHATCHHAGTIAWWSACTLQPPGTAQHQPPQEDFPVLHLGEKTLKLLKSQARLKTNVRDRWESHSQPAKGPGVCCIRYQGCTHVWQFQRATDMTDDWEKLRLLLAVFPLKNFFLEPLYL